MLSSIIDAIFFFAFIIGGCSFAVLGLAFPLFIVVFIYRRFEVWWIYRAARRGTLPLAPDAPDIIYRDDQGARLQRFPAAPTRLPPRIKPAPSVWLLLLYLLVLMSQCRAVDNFIKFQGKAKQSEARTNLGAIFTTQIAYFGERGTYAGGPGAFTLLNWAPEGNTLYAYYCGDDFIPNNSGDPVTFTPNHSWPFTFRPENSDTGFTCLAVGNIDYDGEPDAWSINDVKKVENIASDLGDTDPAKFVGSTILFPDHPVRAKLDSAWRAAVNLYQPGLALFVSIFGSFVLVWLTWREEKRYRADKRRAGVGDG